MKKSKKLMILGLSAATAAVAATSAVSSFAWFASNYTVDATNMVIKAASNDIFLQIRNSSITKWVKNTNYNTAAATVQIASVSPTTVAKAITDTKLTAYDGGTALWASTSSDDLDDAARGDNAKYSDVTSVADPTAAADVATAYTLRNTFTLRLRPTYKADGTLADTQATSGALTSSVEWVTTPTFTADKLAYAVSVLVYTGTAGQLFKVDSTSGKFVASGATSLVDSMTAGEEDKNVTCKVFVFIDGENENCKTSNVQLDSSYSVKVNFTVANA